jgi:uncharacterized Zn finger protein
MARARCPHCNTTTFGMQLQVIATAGTICLVTCNGCGAVLGAVPQKPSA